MSTEVDDLATHPSRYLYKLSHLQKSEYQLQKK
jgi:hypothetical protein